jgi:DNA-binding transcriptional regulator YiaG
MLNSSLSTVAQREIGDKNPSGPSPKPLRLKNRNGLEVMI